MRIDYKRERKDCFRINSPYVALKLGENKYCVVNREYLPLGMDRESCTERIPQGQYDDLMEKHSVTIENGKEFESQSNGLISFYMDHLHPMLGKKNWDRYRNRINEILPQEYWQVPYEYLYTIEKLRVEFASGIDSESLWKVRLDRDRRFGKVYQSQIS